MLNPSESGARKLRTDQTDAEQKLWRRIRRKQILGVQFYRQRPMFGYIVDFYCARVQLVIELDGGQHYEEAAGRKDQRRDRVLSNAGLRVLRFNNRQLMLETDRVIEEIYEQVASRINHA